MRETRDCTRVQEREKEELSRSLLSRTLISGARAVSVFIVVIIDRITYRRIVASNISRPYNRSDQGLRSVSHSTALLHRSQPAHGFEEV